MAEPTHFIFDFREAATALIKAQGLTEGVWAIGFEITVSIGIFGQAPEEARPGSMMQVARVTLGRQPDDPSNRLPFSVDAAEVNPPSGGKARATPKPRGGA